MSLLGVENVIVDKSRLDLKEEGFRSEATRSGGKEKREREASRHKAKYVLFIEMKRQTLDGHTSLVFIPPS
jgi:hypothetical protein